MTTLTFPQRLLIALAGYGLLAAFGVAYFVLKKYGSGLSTNQLLILSAALVAPLGLALLWEHLKGVKIGKIEVKLNEVSPRMDVELASELAELRASVPKALADLLAEAVKNEDFRLVEVNLKSKPYWWSTRLYLLAALAEEYTSIERFVIVENDAARIYVGCAQPAKVRRAMAQSIPELERVYRTIKTQPNVVASPDRISEITNIIHAWTGPQQLQFQTTAPAGVLVVNEEQFKELVDSAKLRGWLGNGLETQMRDYKGERPNRALYCRILGCPLDYVPLVHGRQLETVVNRGELAAKLALSAIW